MDEIHVMIDEAGAANTGDITFKKFLKIIAKTKELQFNDNHAALMDAYVAMGGNEDGSGYIDADAMIKIIKEDF